MQASGRRRPLLPLPFALWHALAFAGQVLPTPPLTEGQVALMSRDNVAPPDLPGLDDLAISPVPLTAVLSEMTGKG
jgi:NADH dehydrogenase